MKLLAIVSLILSLAVVAVELGAGIHHKDTLILISAVASGALAAVLLAR